MKLTIIAIVLAFSLTGCLTTGKNFEVTQVGNIQKGKTKQSEISNWFGVPYMKGLDDGKETWIYNYNEMSIGGNTGAKNLYIVFHNSGVVKRFTFSTSFEKEKSLTNKTGK